MAYGRSYSTWRSRGRYGRYSRRRSSFRRRATGNARAARQQRDSATVTISRIAAIPVVIPTDGRNAAVVINHWDSLRQSTYFDNYSPMYDQMKIDKIRIKVTGNLAGSAQTSNLSPSVVMAFDRNGLNSGQSVTTAVIATYSSSQLKQWSTGNALNMYQTIYPSTIMEKGQYIPTDSLVDPDTLSVSTNPCYNYSDPTLPFKPLTLLGVDLGIAASADQTFGFTVEFEYTVTFRGMRKPSLAYLDPEPISIILPQPQVNDRTVDIEVPATYTDLVQATVPGYGSQADTYDLGTTNTPMFLGQFVIDKVLDTPLVINRITGLLNLGKVLLTAARVGTSGAIVPFSSFSRYTSSFTAPARTTTVYIQPSYLTQYGNGTIWIKSAAASTELIQAENQSFYHTFSNSNNEAVWLVDENGTSWVPLYDSTGQSVATPNLFNSDLFQLNVTF